MTIVTIPERIDEWGC